MTGLRKPKWTDDENVERTVVSYTDNLDSCLSQVRKVFDMPLVLNDAQARPQIIHYYFINRPPLLFYNWGGFFHMA